MVSTFTTNLVLEKQAAGENTDTWGSKINDVLDQLDDAIAGRLSKSVAGSSNVTLTTAEARNAWHEYNGTLTGNINVIVPTTEKLYYVFNNTAGSFTLTVKTSAGSGITVTQGEKLTLYTDGTNVINATDTVNDPLTTRGDIIIRDATKQVRLAVGAANTVLGSDGTDPSWGTVSTAMIANNAVDGTKIAMGSDAQGDILIYGGTDYKRLAAGNSGKFLKTLGAGNDPIWDTPTFSQANQAALEAETDEDTYVPPDLVKHSPGVSKQWVKFDLAGTVNASHNTDSVTDTGAGDWTVNITTDFSSGDYSIAGSWRDDSVGTNNAVGVVIGAQAAGSYQVIYRDSIGGLGDPAAADDMHTQAFGDQA